MVVYLITNLRIQICKQVFIKFIFLFYYYFCLRQLTKVAINCIILIYYLFVTMLLFHTNNILIILCYSY